MNLKFFYQFINLLKLSPVYVNNRHNNNEKDIYKKDWIIFLSTNISTFSREKVENVVNDPKTPIMKKYFIKSWVIFLVSSKNIE